MKKLKRLPTEGKPDKKMTPDQLLSEHRTSKIYIFPSKLIAI